MIYSAYYCPPLVKVGLYFPQRWYDCTSLLRDLGVHRNICGLCTINLHIWKCKSIKQGTFHYRNPYFKCEPNLKWFHMLHIYDTNLEWFHMLHIYDTNFLIVKYVSGNELRLKCKILYCVLEYSTQNGRFGVFSPKIVWYLIWNTNWIQIFNCI